MVIIGAGIGGLTTAAILSKQGLDVTVLEAETYAGGCAGTFFHKGYRFDAGATLAAGFYPGGPMDLVAKAAGIVSWPFHPASPAMQVHLPDGATINCTDSDARWEEYHEVFGDSAKAYFTWQESTADHLWRFALRQPRWPPQNAGDLLSLLKAVDRDMMAASPGLFLDAVSTARSRLRGHPNRLRLFVDGQLLISAQMESDRANALYAASALDLPRRGAGHLEGGMGRMADVLVQAVRANGGLVHFRQKVTGVNGDASRGFRVETKKGEEYEAAVVVFNLPPWNIRDLLRSSMPRSLTRLEELRGDLWGAFMLYVGLNGNALPEGFPLHHQVIRAEPLRNGNSVFISVNPEWDASRAPDGYRAVTISTHTPLQKWWNSFENDRELYESEKQIMVEKVLATAELAIPGIAEKSVLVMPGTPVTFERFTGRKGGWVGGYQQTSLFATRSPRIAKNTWMVGDSIFPGQSTAAVAMGGLRVATEIMESFG